MTVKPLHCWSPKTLDIFLSDIPPVFVVALSECQGGEVGTNYPEQEP